MENKKQKLKAGDYVRDILRDRVFKVSETDSYFYPLKVELDDGSYHTLTRQGLSSTAHKKPRYIKCDPPKEKKAYYQWLDPEVGRLSSYIYTKEGFSKLGETKPASHTVCLEHTKVML